MGWYNINWLDRVEIRTNSSKVYNSNEVLFFDLSLLDDSFWESINADGSDIRITTDDGETELPIEISYINQIEKRGSLWFSTENSLNVIEDTSYYIYFNNNSATSYAPNDTYGRENVWSSYAGVWHFDEISGNTIINSTNGSDGTLTNSSLRSDDNLVGLNLDFSNGNHRADLTNINLSNSPKTFFWITKGSDLTIMHLGTTSSLVHRGVRFPGYINSIEQMSFRYGNGGCLSSGRTDWRSKVFTIDEEKIYYLTLKIDDIRNSNLFFDDEEDLDFTRVSGSASGNVSYENVYHVGNDYGCGTGQFGNWSTSKISELHIYEGSVSEDWVKTNVNCIKDTENFWEIIQIQMVITEIDWNNSNMQKVEIGTDNVSFTFTAPRGPSRLDLKIKNDNLSPINLTFPSNVIWPVGEPNWSEMNQGEICIITFRYDSDNKYIAVATPFYEVN